MTEIDNPFDGEAARIIHQQDVTEQQDATSPFFVT